MLRAGADPAFAFPYRPETLPVLRWAAAEDPHWGWRYLLGLNLWALDRDAEAAEVLATLGDEPDYGPTYAARAHLTEAAGRRPRARLPPRGRDGPRQPPPPHLPRPAPAGNRTLGRGARGVRPGTGTLPGRLQPRPHPRAGAHPGARVPRGQRHPCRHPRTTLGEFRRGPPPVRVPAHRGRAGRTGGREPPARPPSPGSGAAVAGIARPGPALRPRRPPRAVPARRGGGKPRRRTRAPGLRDRHHRLAARAHRFARRAASPIATIEQDLLRRALAAARLQR